MTLPQVVQDAVKYGDECWDDGSDPDEREMWQTIRAELHRLTEIAEGVEPLVIRLGEVTEKLESLRAWNERVSVCRDHTADVVDGECLVCRLAAANALLRRCVENREGLAYEWKLLDEIQSHLQGAGDEA